MLSDIGLLVFIAAVVIERIVLYVDGYLAASGRTTITQWTVRSPWRIALVVGLTLIGPAGVLVHFLAF